MDCSLASVGYIDEHKAYVLGVAGEAERAKAAGVLASASVGRAGGQVAERVHLALADDHFG